MASPEGEHRSHPGGTDQSRAQCEQAADVVLAAPSQHTAGLSGLTRGQQLRLEMGSKPLQLRGAVVREARAVHYRETLGAQLQIFAATPERPMLSDPSFGGRWEVLAPTDLLARLLAAVSGVGPGMSLTDKVTLARTYYAVPDVQATCAVLTGFVHEVRAQRGKKIMLALADTLAADAQAIMAAIGCN